MQQATMTLGQPWQHWIATTQAPKNKANWIIGTPPAETLR